MEGNRVITLELTPRQAEVLGIALRLELIQMNPKNDTFTLEKMNIFNMLHKEIAGFDCFKCDPESFNKAVNYHIAKLKESNEPDEDAIQTLTQLLK